MGKRSLILQIADEKRWIPLGEYASYDHQFGLSIKVFCFPFECYVEQSKFDPGLFSWSCGSMIIDSVTWQVFKISTFQEKRGQWCVGKNWTKVSDLKIILYTVLWITVTRNGSDWTMYFLIGGTIPGHWRKTSKRYWKNHKNDSLRATMNAETHAK